MTTPRGLWGGKASRELRSVMLTPMLDLFRLLFTTVQTATRSQQELVLENLLLRHQLAVLTRPTQRRPWYSASPQGQAVVDPGSPVLRRLARASVLRDSRDGRALASAGLAPVLAMEVPLSRWTPASQSRAMELDRDDVPRQTRCTPRRTSYVERVAVTSSSVPASRPRGVALACPPARCAWTANAGNVVWVLPVLAF